MRSRLDPIVVVVVAGLLLGLSLPTLANVIPATCAGCSPNNNGIKANCNQCGGAEKAVGSNCDICCESSTQCELKPAQSQIDP